MPEDRPVALADGSVVHADPEILGGTLVFVGTRVPVQTLVDYLEGGYSIDGFLDNFPSVRREQVNTFLEQAHHELEDLLPLVSGILEALLGVKAGQVSYIGPIG